SAGLFLAQNLHRQGYRVFVHDPGATPANCPSIHEFERLDSPADLSQRTEVKLVVVCCPWPQYKHLKLPPGARLLSPWRLT
ncbi:MAG: hypothetical protein ACREIC_03185, partial [Limisphaerales bacterium]